MIAKKKLTMAEDEDPLPVIARAFDCDMVELIDNGRGGWLCKHCNTRWNATNRSKILFHLAGINGSGIRVSMV